MLPNGNHNGFGNGITTTATSTDTTTDVPLTSDYCQQHSQSQLHKEQLQLMWDINLQGTGGCKRWLVLQKQIKHPVLKLHGSLGHDSNSNEEELEIEIDFKKRRIHFYDETETEP